MFGLPVHLEVYVDELVGEGRELVAEAGDVLPWTGVRWLVVRWADN